jgi:hypothetical protein
MKVIEFSFQREKNRTKLTHLVQIVAEPHPFYAAPAKLLKGSATICATQ